MRIKKPILTVFFLMVFAAFSVDHAVPQEDDMLEKMAADEELQQEFKWLKAETYVITASKVMENIKKAPASITVITDRRIRQMGARHLVDVLQRAVPSFDPAYGYVGAHGILVRKAFGTNADTILLMINSHPINNAGDSGFAWLHDTMIVENIKRIEVIRGPGSALYGASAFHGVINVITKEAEDIDGFELTARGGSWDTQQYNLLYGKSFSDLEVTFNFNYFKTHGFRSFVEEDYQTYIDEELYPPGVPPASLAPGRAKGNDEKYDVALNLKYKGLMFDGRYVDRERDLPLSWAANLTYKGVTPDYDYYLNLGYEKSIWKGLDLSGKVYRNLYYHSFDTQEYPPGFFPTPTGSTYMTNGLYSETSFGKAIINGIEIQATYKLTDSNTVVAGGTYEEHKQYGQSTSANFLPSPIPNTIIPLPSVQRWPDNLIEDTHKRNLKAFFLEDIWDITNDIRLTTGVRYDHYSDFGSEVSPRVGLTWQYIQGYDLKLLYGHAFRAPSFGELYQMAGGNPDLDAEQNDTYEISLGADFTPSLNSRVTFYHREAEDLIVFGSLFPPWNFENQGRSRDQGIEVEAKYDFGKGTYVAADYNYYSIKSGTLTSSYRANLMTNIRLSRYLNFYADCQYADSLGRLPGDTRDDPPSYTLVNATLIAKKFLKNYKGFELRASVYNLLDKEWKFGTVQEIAKEMEAPGIHYLLEIKYTF